MAYYLVSQVHHLLHNWPFMSSGRTTHCRDTPGRSRPKLVQTLGFMRPCLPLPAYFYKASGDDGEHCITQAMISALHLLPYPSWRTPASMVSAGEQSCFCAAYACSPICTIWCQSANCLLTLRWTAEKQSRTSTIDNLLCCMGLRCPSHHARALCNSSQKS